MQARSSQAEIYRVLFVDLGPVEGRGDRVIAALGKPYTAIDSPCIIVDDLRER